MAKTGAQLQTMLAYRLGESSATSDATVKAQRYQWLTDGYFNIARRRNWFWQEASNTANSNDGTADYTEPSDLKEFIELVIDDVYYDQIPYQDNRIYTNSLGVVTLPTLRKSYKYYRFGGTYYLIPTPGNDSVTHNIKYYKRVTTIDDDADTILLPDEYADALPAYAEGRYWLSISQQAKAATPFQEYEEIVAELAAEQARRGWGAQGWRIKDPEDVFE